MMMMMMMMMVMMMKSMKLVFAHSYSIKTVTSVLMKICSSIGVPVMVHLGGGARPNLPEF